MFGFQKAVDSGIKIAKKIIVQNTATRTFLTTFIIPRVEYGIRYGCRLVFIFVKTAGDAMRSFITNAFRLA